MTAVAHLVWAAVALCTVVLVRLSFRDWLQKRHARISDDALGRAMAEIGEVRRKLDELRRTVEGLTLERLGR